MVKLSIIIVSYNEKEYLPKAIKSCMQQNFPYDYEIIIGDDGSDDGSIELIKKYSEQHKGVIKYFVMSRENISDVIPSLRVSDIIKRALKSAEGEYIICLSGDDWFCNPDSFNMQMQTLENDKRKKYSAAVAGFKMVWNDSKEETAPMYRLPPYIFWSGVYIHISCFMFRREVYDKKALLKRFCDDTGLIYSIACMGKFYYIRNVAFAYRQRDKSIVHEADKLELSILELMLMQDIFIKGKFIIPSLSRFALPLWYTYRNRHKLTEPRYEKYVLNSKKYKFDIIGRIISSDSSCLSEKMKLYGLLLISRIAHCILYTIGYVCNHYNAAKTLLRLLHDKTISLKKGKH